MKIGSIVARFVASWNAVINALRGSAKVGGESYEFEPAKNNNPGNDYMLVEQGNSA